MLSKWGGFSNRKKKVWVGESLPFFIDDDLMAAWEFEILLQKKDETLEHYGN